MSAHMTLPVFPLKNAALFPHTVAPLAANRPLSVSAIEAVTTSEEKEFVLVERIEEAFSAAIPQISQMLHPVPA